MILTLSVLVLFGLLAWKLASSAKFAEPMGRNQAVRKILENNGCK